MATTTAPAKARTKKASVKTASTKSTVPKAVKRAASPKVGAKKAAAKTVKAPVKRAAARRAAGAGPSGGRRAAAVRRPVTLNGQPASNRHFLLDRDLYNESMARVAEDGLSLSDVLRHGIDVYAKKAPKEDVPDKTQVLPRGALAEIKRMYKAGESDRLNEYLAALHRGQWTMQALADSFVAAGLVDKISRQAVSLRINKAPEALSADLPPVPELGPRRSLPSPRKGKTKEEYEAASKKRGGKSDAHDLAFRVEDSAYHAAARRAKRENAMMSGVLDEVLVSYLAGDFDKHFKKARAGAMKG